MVSQEPGEGAVQPGLRTLDQRACDLRVTQGKVRASHGDCVVTTRWRPAGDGEGLPRASPCCHPRLTRSPRGAHCLCLSGQLDYLRVKLEGAGCPASVPTQGAACVHLHGETSDQPAFQPSLLQGPAGCGRRSGSRGTDRGTEGQRPVHLCTLIPAKCRSSQAWPSRDRARPAGSSTQACGPWIPPGGWGLRWATGGWRDGLRLLRQASHPWGGRQGKSPHGHRSCSPSSQLPSLPP